MRPLFFGFLILSFSAAGAEQGAGRVGLSTAFGKDRSIFREISSDYSITSTWTLQAAFSTTSDKSGIINKEASFGGLLRPDQNNRWSFGLIVGKLYETVDTSTLSAGYRNRSDWIFTERDSEIGLTLEVTEYRESRVLVSPRESRSILTLAQQVSESVTIGLTGSKVARTAAAIRQFNRMLGSRDPGLYAAGPMEDSSSLYVDWTATEDDLWELSFAKTSYTDGGTTNSTIISWDRYWSDNWETKTGITSTRDSATGTTSSTLALDFSYLF